MRVRKKAPKITKKCNHCENIYTANRRDQRFCSDSCRVLEARKRLGYEYVSQYVAPTKLKKELVGITKTAVGTIVGLGAYHGLNALLMPSNKKNINSSNHQLTIDAIKYNELRFDRIEKLLEILNKKVTKSHNINFNEIRKNNSGF